MSCCQCCHLLDSICPLVQVTFTPQVGCVCRSRLFSHVDDPFLDDPLPREYVLYLRPSGPLLHQLTHFWQQSRISCGKNKAHNIFPHITLCQFFMVSMGWLKTSQYHKFDLLKCFKTFLHFRDQASMKLVTFEFMSFVRAPPAGHQANVQQQLYSMSQEKVEYLKCISWIHISLLSVWWWKGGGAVWCSPSHHGQVEGSHTDAGPTGALHVLHLHRPLCGGAGCRAAEGLRFWLCHWSSG